MESKSVAAGRFFFLAPPLISRRGCGFAVIQLGEDFSETLMVRMDEWSAETFFAYWMAELRELVEGNRSKGVLPCGVYRDCGAHGIQLGERWEVFRCGNELAFHDRTVVFPNDPCLNSSSHIDPQSWWQLVPDYVRKPVIQDTHGIYYESEWRVTVESVAEWCRRYACVFAQMDNVDSDTAFIW